MVTMDYAAMLWRRVIVVTGEGLSKPLRHDEEVN
jgi:hypothetical protein